MNGLTRHVTGFFLGSILGLHAQSVGSTIPENVAGAEFGRTSASSVTPLDSKPDAPSLPVIMPNGIVTLSGVPQALFKVSDTAGETAYVLGAGEGRGGIKVISIDQPDDTITFDNHGTIQKLAVTRAVLAGAPASPASSATISNPPAPVPIDLNLDLPPITPADADNDDHQGEASPVAIISIGNQSASPSPFKHRLGLSAPAAFGGNFNSMPALAPSAANPNNSPGSIVTLPTEAVSPPPGRGAQMISGGDGMSGAQMPSGNPGLSPTPAPAAAQR